MLKNLLQYYKSWSHSFKLNKLSRMNHQRNTILDRKAAALKILTFLKNSNNLSTLLSNFDSRQIVKEEFFKFNLSRKHSVNKLVNITNVFISTQCQKREWKTTPWWAQKKVMIVVNFLSNPIRRFVFIPQSQLLVDFLAKSSVSHVL